MNKVVKLYDLYVRGQIVGPERHERNPGLPSGTRDNYLYFTLPCAINYQRSSPAMWRSALDCYVDDRTRFVFYPELSTKARLEVVKSSLTKHRLAVQPHMHTDIWLRIPTSFCDHYDSDPRNFLGECDYDVPRIVRALQMDKKSLFPYLSGIKISNYWLFILTLFTDAPLQNTHEISIIPDTHVIKSTIRLGLAREGARALEVEGIWRDVSRATGIRSVDMHPALWRWSRNGFQPAIL